MPDLTAVALKKALWETLTKLTEDKIQAVQADAIAAQAREILRTIKIQLQIANQTDRAVPNEVIAFSEKEK